MVTWQSYWLTGKDDGKRRKYTKTKSENNWTNATGSGQNDVRYKGGPVSSCRTLCDVGLLLLGRQVISITWQTGRYWLLSTVDTWLLRLLIRARWDWRRGRVWNCVHAGKSVGFTKSVWLHTQTHCDIAVRFVTFFIVTLFYCILIFNDFIFVHLACKTRAIVNCFLLKATWLDLHSQYK